MSVATLESRNSLRGQGDNAICDESHITHHRLEARFLMTAYANMVVL
jgi:hypothetical protein